LNTAKAASIYFEGCTGKFISSVGTKRKKVEGQTHKDTNAWPAVT